MAVSTGHVVCPSNTETLVIAAAVTGRAGSAARGRSRTVIIRNPSAQDVWIGDGVSDATDGFLLVSGATITFDIGPADAIYGQGASSSPTLHYIESGT